MKKLKMKQKELKKQKKKVNREYLTYKTDTKNIHEGKITLDNVDEDLLFMIYCLKLVISIKPQNQGHLVRKKGKEILYMHFMWVEK